MKTKSGGESPLNNMETPQYPETAWSEVTRDEFFRAIEALTFDVHPAIQPGKYPYTEIWQTPLRSAIGKSVGRIESGRALTTWFLRHNAEVSRGDGSASLNPNQTSNEH